MLALIDADVLRYELGFAAETGYKAITENPDAIPPWSYVDELTEMRIEHILHATKADEYCLYITEGRTFRDAIAVTKPYKGTRPDKKPWHYDNLTAHFVHTRDAEVITEIEADDALAIEHVKRPDDSILVSRDKDLRQVPGWFYSWELGNQPSFGPALITKMGHIRLDEKRKLRGTGLAFFYSQVLTGDVVDNIPGLPKCGPVAAYNLLHECETPQELLDAVIDAYKEAPLDDWEAYLLEQGRLCWMTRRLHPDGKPVLWEIGMEE